MFRQTEEFWMREREREGGGHVFAINLCRAGIELEGRAMLRAQRIAAAGDVAVGANGEGQFCRLRCATQPTYAQPCLNNKRTNSRRTEKSASASSTCMFYFIMITVEGLGYQQNYNLQCKWLGQNKQYFLTNGTWMIPDLLKYSALKLCLLLLG